MMQTIRSLVGGFFMGAADLVPGVSGGTIALVLGIYERLVGSIKEGSSALGSIARGRFSDGTAKLRDVEWGLLVPLVLGIGTAVVLLASLIHDQLEQNPTVMSGAFFGLVLGSIVIAWRLIKHPREWYLLVTTIVGVAVFALLGFGDDSIVADPSLLLYFGAGAFAICAMILPGISGALMLLLVGMYQPVLDAVDGRDFPTLLVFAGGAIIGLALFSQALKWALDRYHDPVVAGLIGLMVGSLRVLWPWPQGVDSTDLSGPGGDWVSVSLAALAGIAAVFAIARLGSARSR